MENYDWLAYDKPIGISVTSDEQVIDFNAVKTIEDVIAVLKLLDLSFYGEKFENNTYLKSRAKEQTDGNDTKTETPTDDSLRTPTRPATE